MQPPQTSEVDLIIQAGWIIPMEVDKQVLCDHAILISQDKIVGIEKACIAKHYKNAEFVERPNHVLLPGLINAHGHSAMTLFRGLADDLPLMDWLNHHIWPAENRWVSNEFVRHGAQLALAEMIRAGTTTFCDQYFFPEATAAAAISANVRCRLNTPVLDFPSPWASSADEYIDKGLQLNETFQDQALISTAFGPHATYTVSDKPLKRLQQLAESRQLGIHIHVNETAHEVREALQLTGLRPLERFHKLGLLSPRFQAVHMTQANERDISLLAESGSQVIHCPESNLKLASGLCPVKRLQESGINVALGTDGAASNNDLDLISELRTASLIAKLVDHDATALPAYEALKLATLNGAKALGLEHKIGSLRAGKQADIIAVDLSAPELQPLYSPVSQLVYSAGREHVSDVWVAGRQIMNQRTLTTIDLDEVLQHTKQWRNKIASSQ